MAERPAHILVTGGSGLLGANILCSLPASWSAVALTNTTELSVPTVQMDLTTGDIASLVEDMRPTAIIHTAAITNVDACEGDLRDHAHALHVEATGRLARAAQAVGAHIVHISTDQLFDGQGGAYRIADEPKPMNWYAKTKWLGEQEIRASGADVAIIRTNFFGFNAYEKDDFAAWILSGLMSGEERHMFTDVVFSPILVNTLVLNIFHILDRRATGIFHIAARDACSKFDFAVALARAFGLPTDRIRPATLQERGLFAPRPKDMSLDVEETERALGLRFPTVAESIAAYRQLETEQFQKHVRDTVCIS